MTLRLPLALCATALTSLLAPGIQAQDKAGVAFFEKHIRPVLVKECYSCHSAKAKAVKGSLLLDSRAGWTRGGESGTAVVPGKPGESLLIEAVR